MLEILHARAHLQLVIMQPLPLVVWQDLMVDLALVQVLVLGQLKAWRVTLFQIHIT